MAVLKKIGVLFLLSICVVGTIVFSGCNVEIEKSFDLSEIPIEEMSLRKGVSATIPQLSLRMGYMGMEDSGYLLKVEHTGDDSCDTKEISLSKETPVHYICKEEEYMFNLNPFESDSDKITFSVKSLKEKTEPQVKTSEERECLFSKDCEEGFHCANKKCVNNDILLAKQSCESNDDCSQECENCKNGEMRCMLSSEELKNKKCVECFMNMQCKEGHICEGYECVAE